MHPLFNKKVCEVNVLNNFEIPFKGLSFGAHEYEFTINDSFFEAITYSEITQGQLICTILLENNPGMMQLEFTIRGTVKLICDRCVEEFDYPIECHEILIVKTGPETKEESDEVIIIAHNETKLVLWQYIYEYISLQVPYRKVHPDDENGNSTCNPEQIERIVKLSSTSDTDPRWDALRNIQLDND